MRNISASGSRSGFSADAPGAAGRASVKSRIKPTHSESAQPAVTKKAAQDALPTPSAMPRSACRGGPHRHAQKLRRLLLHPADRDRYLVPGHETLASAIANTEAADAYGTRARRGW